MTAIIPAGSIAAWRRLSATLENHSGVIPCAGSLRWVSGDAEVRAGAAVECGSCPVAVKQACGEYAELAKENSGVWPVLIGTASLADQRK